MVVKEIKMRGQTVRNKVRLMKELKARKARVEKKQTYGQCCWRRQRELLHCDLHEYFADRIRKTKAKEQKLELNDKAFRRTLWEMLLNRDMRQRRLKKKMQRELLVRFRTVDLKSKLCEDILEYKRNENSRRQAPLVASYPDLPVKRSHTSYT